MWDKAWPWFQTMATVKVTLFVAFAPRDVPRKGGSLGQTCWLLRAATTAGAWHGRGGEAFAPDEGVLSLLLLLVHARLCDLSHSPGYCIVV